MMSPVRYEGSVLPGIPGAVGQPWQADLRTLSLLTGETLGGNPESNAISC